jgi:hypothetical protein
MPVEGDPNYNIHSWLESEGAEVDIQLVTAWLLYNVWQVSWDTKRRMTLREEDEGRQGLKGKDARKRLDSLWAEENQLLPVTVISAVELDEGLVNDIGKRIEEHTGRQVELSSKVDPDVLGGLQVRVGSMVLDATVRNRLEQLRKQVAKAA